MHVVKDLKLGRLPKDSITLRADSLLSSEFYLNRLSLAQLHSGLSLVFHALEPDHKGYEELKKAIPAFLDSADYRPFTTVPSPKAKNPDFKKSFRKDCLKQDWLPLIQHLQIRRLYQVPSNISSTDRELLRMDWQVKKPYVY